jgi:parvulin-like peptidyl-prolyl isomerase
VAGDRTITARRAAAVLGGALVLVLIYAFTFGDAGQPGVPDGDVAFVEEVPTFDCVVGTGEGKDFKPEVEQCDGNITDAQFQRSLEQSAFNLNLKEVPPEDDPQFEQVEQSALLNLIQTRWVRGEAADRGIEVTDRDVDVAYEQIIREQLGGAKGLEKFLTDAPFTEEEIREVAELTEISDRLQSDALPEEPPPVDDELVQDFYETNADQFTQPESRDVREILNKDEAQIEKAQEELGDDPTPEDWKRVAAKYSTDDATKGEGGLRSGVVEGQGDPAVEEEIFSAAEGELVGPFETETGFHLIQVEAITPEEVAPLDEETSQQIEAQLGQGIQAQVAERFRTSFISKWRARTVCADDLRVELCANADPPPDACMADDESEREQAPDPALLEQGCEAFVTPRPVVEPGENGGFPGEQSLVLPQGPIKPPEEGAATGVPPGLQGLPPGAAPPGGAPPGGAAPPPQGGTAPPPGG